jgi:AcrR family transcriptional regulator
MMVPAYFEATDFLDAARQLAADHGPACVTVNSVIERLKAPKGSFYYRFASRDMLLGELWLAAVLSYQEGWVPAIESGDGLAAALHTPAWVRRNLDDARLLLLYSRHDFVQGEWPAPLRKGVADQARRLEAALARFAKDTFGSADPENLRIAQFVLTDIPLAAVQPHLLRREAPPPLVDDLIRVSYRAVIQARSKSKKPHRNSPPKRR